MIVEVGNQARSRDQVDLLVDYFTLSLLVKVVVIC